MSVGKSDLPNRNGTPKRCFRHKALETLWCVDDSFASDNSYTGSQAKVTENVLHLIAIKLENKTILLGFNSFTEMTHYSSFWSDYVRTISGKDLRSGLSMFHHKFLESIFNRLDLKACGQSPQGYSTDSGSFIGLSNYTLVSVGELPVDGPTYIDSYHEQN